MAYLTYELSTEASLTEVGQQGLIHLEHKKRGFSFFANVRVSEVRNQNNRVLVIEKIWSADDNPCLINTGERIFVRFNDGKPETGSFGDFNPQPQSAPHDQFPSTAFLPSEVIGTCQA